MIVHMHASTQVLMAQSREESALSSHASSEAVRVGLQAVQEPSIKVMAVLSAQAIASNHFAHYSVCRNSTQLMVGGNITGA